MIFMIKHSNISEINIFSFKILFILFYQLGSMSCFSQSIAPIRNTNNNSYEYINTISKKVISKYSYDQAAPFNDGLARVSRNGLYGFINLQGNEVIACKYINANNFSEGLASVSIDNNLKENETGFIISAENEKYGVIDKSGNIVLPFEFGLIGSFKNNLARAKEINSGKWGYINKDGYWKITPKFSSADDFNELHLAKVSIYKSKEELNSSYPADAFGYINEKGEYVIPALYTYLSDFQEGLTIAYNSLGCGLINATGAVIVPFIYDRMEFFKEKLALVVKTNSKGERQFGFIDKFGNQQIQLMFEYAHSFSNGMAFVKKDGRYGWINSTGNFVIPNIYDLAEDFIVPDNYYPYLSAFYQFKFKSALVSKNGFWGAINLAGKEIVPVLYDYIAKSKNGFLVLKGNNKLCIDEQGSLKNENYCDTTIVKIAMSDYKYRGATTISKNHSHNKFKNKIYKPSNLELTNQFDIYSKFLRKKLTKKDNFYGLVNEDGSIFLNQVYDSIKKIDYFDYHGFVGFRNNKLHLINEIQGKAVIIQTYYTDFVYDKHADGFISVKKDNKWGIIKVIDKKIVEIINIEYESIGYFSDKIPVMKNKKWGFFDVKLGKIKIPFQYDDALYFSNYGFLVKKNNKWGIINKNNEEIVPFLFEDILDNWGDADLFPVKKNGKWGFINEFGVNVIPYVFDEVSSFYEVRSNVELNKKEIAIDSYGAWIYDNYVNYVDRTTVH